MIHTYALESKQPTGPVYLDCNATAPMEPAARDTLVRWLTDEIGNAGSRTHEFGLRAKQAVQSARAHVAAVVSADANEVLFTSGATESNNIAILGLARHAETTGRRHIVSTAIEHKAVLEPLEVLQARGFEVTLIAPSGNGAVTAEAVRNALRPDTVLVSVMHVNNETGVRQPIDKIAATIGDHDAFLHTDAAQGFGKDLDGLRSERIDLISVSAHKIYGPLGIGALIARRRGYTRSPLSPLAHGGGQERGLRPGTLPVPLIIGFGVAAERAVADNRQRRRRCNEIRAQALAALETLDLRVHGDPDLTLPHVINFSVPGLDSEAVMIALKQLAAVSNGSACTSQSYQPSHVLRAMDLPDEAISGALRFSWCHMTPNVDWHSITQRIASLT